MTNEEIDDVIQKLYAWAEKREQVNKTRSNDPNFQTLDQALLKRAIKTIQYLQMRSGSGIPEAKTRRL